MNSTAKPRIKLTRCRTYHTRILEIGDTQKRVLKRQFRCDALSPPPSSTSSSPPPSATSSSPAPTLAQDGRALIGGRDWQVRGCQQKHENQPDTTTCPSITISIPLLQFSVYQYQYNTRILLLTFEYQYRSIPKSIDHLCFTLPKIY